MKTKILSFLVLTIFAMTACVEHEPNIEELPSPAVNFKYTIVDDTYQIDYYVGANIAFINTSSKDGVATWDFADGTTLTGDSVTHKFVAEGTYNVKLTIANVGSVEKPIMINDIKPILNVNPIEGGLCEVKNTYVSFNVELPNPQALTAVYTWTFPAGTVSESGDDMETFVGEDPGKVQFAKVGSQRVALNVDLGGRALQESYLNVQVAYNTEVPTLYYAAKGGNIMAVKIPANTPEGIFIEPFDLGVSSGQTAQNILFKDSMLYVLDCGKQFTYVNDEEGILGDGSITAIYKDGSRVETVITNKGNAFDDPFYGYIDGNKLYFSNRNTGVTSISIFERNRAMSPDEFPYYFENQTLGYYGFHQLAYGGMNAGFGKVNGVWYWCKTFNGYGIYRFEDSDILSEKVESGKGTPPAAGVALEGMSVKSFAYDSKRGNFFFAVANDGYKGVYKCTLEELNTIGGDRTKLAPYMLKTADGKTMQMINTPGVGDGSDGEYISICQMSVSEEDGSLYFALRSADADVESGIYRYNPASGNLELLVNGVQAYGVVVNNNKSKLF